MNKKKIKFPSEITVDTYVYKVTSNEIIPGTNMKEYDAPAMKVTGVRISPDNPDSLEVEALSRESHVDIQFKNKNHHNPKEKEEEIFLNEDDALKVVRKLSRETESEAEKILKIAKQAVKFWEGKESISPNSKTESKTFEIQTTSKEVTVEVSDTKDED